MGLSCDAGNTRAIALYRSLGWQQGGDAGLKYAAKIIVLNVIGINV